MRLLVANHPFVDGNKRTALATVTVFYGLNGCDLDYDDDDVRKHLKSFATDERSVGVQEVIAYLRRHAEPPDDARSRGNSYEAKSPEEGDRTQHNGFTDEARRDE